MTRFIFFCMAIIALSFIAVPVFTGISKEHNALTTPTDTVILSDDTLSFEEIYEIAGSNTSFDPASLNNITPAAGGNNNDAFSNGFSGTEDSALENSTHIVIEEVTSNIAN